MSMKDIVPSISSMGEDDADRRIREELDRAVVSVCPYCLADSREDIVQNAMIRVLQVRSRSEGNRHFVPSYLWRVAYTSLVDEIRRRESRKEEPLHSDEDSLAAPAVEANPERACAGREIGEAVQNCLGVLVRSRRIAVILYLQGYGVPEAAVMLGWGRKKVENLVYRGLADLRRCLRTKGIEP